MVMAAPSTSPPRRARRRWCGNGSMPTARNLACTVRCRAPTQYNIGVDVCDRWAEIAPERTAILDVGADGRVDEIGYGTLRADSNRLANVLAAYGIKRGDRVAILLPQSPAVVLSHVSVYK